MTERTEPKYNKTTNEEDDFRCPWCARTSYFDSDDVDDDDIGIEHKCCNCQRVSVLEDIETKPREFTWKAKR